MKTLPAIILAVAGVGAVAVHATGTVDPRLATIRKAFIAAADDLSDDKPIAVCVADRISRQTPIESVRTKDEADIILTVTGSSLGKHPLARLNAVLPDGTQLWEGGTKTRGFNLVGRNMTCPLAEDLISNLKDAMKKARDGK